MCAVLLTPLYVCSTYDLLTPLYVCSTYGPIDPTLDTTWPFLENLYTEIVKVFQDDYIHIGGDEVSFTCWSVRLLHWVLSCDLVVTP